MQQPQQTFTEKHRADILEAMRLLASTPMSRILEVSVLIQRIVHAASPEVSQLVRHSVRSTLNDDAEIESDTADSDPVDLAELWEGSPGRGMIVGMTRGGKPAVIGRAVSVGAVFTKGTRLWICYSLGYQFTVDMSGVCTDKRLTNKREHDIVAVYLAMTLTTIAGDA